MTNFLASNWEMIMTLINTIGIAILHSKKANK